MFRFHGKQKRQVSYQCSVMTVLITLVLFFYLGWNSLTYCLITVLKFCSVLGRGCFGVKESELLKYFDQQQQGNLMVRLGERSLFPIDTNSPFTFVKESALCLFGLKLLHD